MGLFQELSQRAGRQNLRFVIIGGHAVMFHGVQRGTEDADILVNSEESQAWRLLVESLGYALKHDGGSFLQFDSNQANEWDLDLMLVSRSTFEKVYEEAVLTEFEAHPVRVASFEHLIALKAHALNHGRGLRVLKDLTDVASLLKFKGIDAKDPWLGRIFAKYGSPETYAKVQQLLTE